MSECTFKPTDTEPCATCPRRMSELYRCGILNDVFRGEPLYVVWIDTDMGYYPGDWEMNSTPKPLQEAIAEEYLCQFFGFPTKVLQEGSTPRADGLFSNPDTDA